MKLERAIWSTAIAVFSLVAGFVAGASLTSRMNDENVASSIDKTTRLRSDDEELAQLRTEKASWEEAALGLKKRAETCEANYSTYTVLYEPGTSPSISLMHGFVNLEAGAASGLQSPAHPAWVIPAKIEPRVIASQPGLVYGYIDRDTRQIDGPYPPTVIANGDKFTVAGWSPR